MRHRQKATDPAFNRCAPSFKAFRRLFARRGRLKRASEASVEPSKKAKVEAEVKSEAEDSDFHSSDLDPVLWAVRGEELEESGAELWILYDLMA